MLMRPTEVEMIDLEQKGEYEMDQDNEDIENRTIEGEGDKLISDNQDGHVFNPILFTRGIESDSFYLILSGKVSVCSGNEGFMIT